MASLLIQESLGAGCVGDELLGLEPQADLTLGVLQGVAAVDDVPADVDAQVSTDAAGLGVSRVGLTQHHPGQLHNALTLPHHGEDGSGGHVLAESTIEGHVLQVQVVLLHVVLRGLHEFGGHQLEASVLESLHDLTAESSLDAIRLHGDECTLHVNEEEAVTT